MSRRGNRKADIGSAFFCIDNKKALGRSKDLHALSEDESTEVSKSGHALKNIFELRAN